VNSQLSKLIKVELIYRNLEHDIFCGKKIPLIECCGWSISQCLQTSNEALAMLFTYGFQKFISNVNVFIFEKKLQKFYFKIEFQNKFPMWKGPLENIWMLQNYINRALFRIFGSCDKRSLDYIKTSTGLHNMKGIVERRHCNFIDKLISDVHFSKLTFRIGLWV